MVHSARIVGVIALAASTLPAVQASALSRDLQRPIHRVLPPPTLAQGTSAAALIAEADALFEQALQQFRIKDYEGARESLQQALTVYQQLAVQAAYPEESLRREAQTLRGLGEIQRSIGDYRRALDYYGRALGIQRSLQDLRGAAVTLNNVGAAYENLGEYDQALTFFEEALVLHRSLSNREGIGQTLSNIGTVYSQQGQYSEALEYYQQALALRRETRDRQGEGITLNNIGAVHDGLGQYSQALDTYQQALDIFQALGNQAQQGLALNNMGAVYAQQGDYEQALTYYQEALAVYQSISDQRGAATSINNVGSVYGKLGQYEKALSYYQDALAIYEFIGDREGFSTTLNNIGLIFGRLGQYDRALRYYRDSLPIFQELGDRAGEGVALHNIGAAYDQRGEYEQALAYYRESLAIRRAIGDRAGEGSTLSNIGTVHRQLGQYDTALDAYEQALVIRQAVGDRRGNAITLANLGHVLEALDYPELAIVFFKQAVNQYEAIRGDIQGLDIELQQSFTENVAGTYRQLAGLLLAQDRILEAQRVLDLLKVQELDEYFQDVRRSTQTEGGVDFWQVETDLLTLYEQVLSQATELEELETKLPGERTEAEQQRLNELRATRDDARGWFYRFLDDPDVIDTVNQVRASTQGQNLEPQNFEDLTNNLRLLPQKTAALYPLILADRLELVLILPDGPPLRYPIAVSSDELKQVVIDFGQALKSPTSDPKPLAQQLYTWLIAPLADQLEQAEIEALIYSPDGALRYIPLATLHDGEQYLAQQFSISHITAASLTDINLQPQHQNQRLLAAACAECSFTVTVGDQTFPFGDLPYTETEVQILSQQLPEADVLLNQAFTPAAMADLPSYSIVHLATHAAFVAGSPDESFILFGDGNTVNLRDIGRDWTLDNADLVVLSACETAVGSTDLGNGVEILGLGYQIEQAGALATLASLWKVSDGGTQALMNAFYGALQQTGMTKAEALRQAQIALITDDLTAVGMERGTVEIISTETGQPITGDDLSHPYYWAPFILIGNGL